MDIFVARQPIFNQHREVYAYELLFRSGFENAFGNVNGDQASSKVMTNSFLGIGLDTLTGGKRAFVNFTRDLLVQEIALLFPSEQLVVEILENVEPDEEVLDSCKSLKQAGYSLALDDFCFESKYEPLVKLADLIKVDFLLTTSDERCEKTPQLTDQGITLLAEKVETQEVFEEALQLGYTYFQGYFFSKPVVVSQRGIPGFKVPYIQILQSIRRPEIDFAELERIIKSDLSLTHQLLRYINRFGFGFVREIESVRHALTLLGHDNLRKLVSLVVLSSVVEDKPQELLAASLIRATLCESLADTSGLGGRKFDLFLLGLFSMIDAVLDLPLPEALSYVPLPEDVKAALLHQRNPFGDLWNMVLAYEKGEWDVLSTHAKNFGLSESEVAASYLPAVQWAEDTVRL